MYENGLHTQKFENNNSIMLQFVQYDSPSDRNRVEFSDRGLVFMPQMNTSTEFWNSDGPLLPLSFQIQHW
jgi:hypothetical protein